MNELESMLDDIESIKDRLADYVSKNDLEETDPAHEALHSMDEVIDWMEQAAGREEDA